MYSVQNKTRERERKEGKQDTQKINAWSCSRTCAWQSMSTSCWASHWLCSSAQRDGCRAPHAIVECTVSTFLWQEREKNKKLKEGAESEKYTRQRKIERQKQTGWGLRQEETEE